jgi:hypothetical protein
VKGAIGVVCLVGCSFIAGAMLAGLSGWRAFLTASVLLLAGLWLTSRPKVGP